jgi:DNA-binding FrmR family transcriptional regulator
MAEQEKSKNGFLHDHGDGNPHWHDADEAQESGAGKHMHTHDDSEHGHSHEQVPAHGHDFAHGHSHTHTHTQTKAVLNRLSRAMGHLESVKRMVEDGRDCSEVLIQLAAVRAALTNTGKVILKDHIGHCLVEAVETRDYTAIEELNKAIERFLD